MKTGELHQFKGELPGVSQHQGGGTWSSETDQKYINTSGRLSRNLVHCVPFKGPKAPFTMSFVTDHNLVQVEGILRLLKSKFELINVGEIRTGR